ncbi:MAG: hypothetical protein JXR85_07620 [Deltaproteobacteria bacterium]|nr:hypothetical protein [Deltaproteobacteria bacterium]
MIVICRNCGAVNNVKRDKKLHSVINITCRQCKTQTSLQIGVSSRSVDTVKCPACGYRQPNTDRCAKCGTDIITQQREFSVLPGEGEKKPKTLADRYKVLTVIAVVLIVTVFLTILTAIFFMMKSSDAYRAAEVYIKNNKDIRETVGDGMKFGFLPLGSVNISGQRGVADFKISVKGSRGSTDVDVFLRKQGSGWRVVAMAYTDRYGTKRRIVPPADREG